MGIFKVTRETKIILAGVLLISVSSFSAAFFYYRGINRSEDPRVLAARYMFTRYDDLIKVENYPVAMLVLDSIEGILLNTPGYSDSWEMGIVWNNRASIYITKALYQENDSMMKQNLLDSAVFFIHPGMELYKQWIGRFGSLSEKQIEETVKPFFSPADKAFQGYRYDKILRKRIKDIQLSQTETPRRLSVAYTNLGIIQRHRYKTTDAAESYVKALELWKDNPAALGNLNVLYGKPYKDRSVLKKIFPPSRFKTEGNR